MRILIIPLILALLSGCQLLSTEPLSKSAGTKVSKAPAVLPDVIDTTYYPDVVLWLSEVRQLMAFTEDQAQAELQQPFNVKTGSPQQLFRYALLNQQLKDWLGWIRARDSLEKLAENPKLSVPLLSLIRLLQFHNQSMINADARQSRLLDAMQEQASELELSQHQVIELSTKIEALTNLEKSMSIRRALTTDTPKGPAND